MTQQIPSTVPICIIGAGPSGATTAMFLSKMGIPHLLLDAAVFPRDKICGDGLDLNTMRVLNQYDPQLVYDLLADTAHFTRVRGVRLIAPNGKHCEAYYDDPTDRNRPLYITGRRIDFDSFLHQQLDSHYTNAHFGAQVTDLVRRDNGIAITIKKDGQTFETFTQLVIGADGDHSVVQRKLDARKIDRTYYAAALRMYHRNVGDMPTSNLLEVYFPKHLPFGYFWTFPLANGEANVGMGMASHQLSKSKINLREAFADLLKNDPFFAHRFEGAEALEQPQGWGLPLASRMRKNYGDNYLLTGDAGSLIHPLSGEGIGAAMISGFAAAKYAERALENHRFDEAALQNFQTETTRRMRTEINIYRQMTRLNPPLWQNTFLNGLIGSGLAKPLFERAAKKWIDTAFNKPIEVQF
jgi:menaquinone-9 beta-reductase